MSTELKARAKRLRAAIQTELGVKVSHSKSLELVAKEENFPTWDAAVAAHQSKQPDGAQLSAKIQEQRWPEPQCALEGGDVDYRFMMERFRPTERGGSITLIGGLTNSGKTTFLRAVLDEYLRTYDGLVGVSNEEYESHGYDRDRSRLVRSAFHQGLPNLNDTKRLILDDLRTDMQIKAAFSAALNGAAVIGSIHGRSGSWILERLYQMGIDDRAIRLADLRIYMLKEWGE
ncbi:ATPase subunit of ABC transporter with duplicated ATPase domains [Pseudomonas nitritireducens]|uniref:ATPase subunit of ABC transporter with duplicated ATPase domains n=1 Tax=Pseudomonas nitroreducens TaxID=46680 RepID=A0A7W7P2Z8_PSENT|nr:ATPase, T2SS/T4P/T4SS family [Pseudomonas nitritireducens]MBB4865294.1 ATPase subunit of ABC transporter with duplicated ATPase domains [Pseudomonas nitritireducens]